MKTEYSAYIELELPSVIDEDRLIETFDCLDARPALLGVVVGGGSNDHCVDVRYNVKADNPTEAIEIGLAQLFKALGCKDPDPNCEIVSIEAERYVSEELKEPISQAEIARRLGISRARIHQLTQTKGFPHPAAISGRTKLYRWGDVEAWQRRREAKMKVDPLTKGADRIYA